MNSNRMDKAEEQILRAAKEIVVKFIETGRVSPTTFPETFRTVYLSIEEMVNGPVRDLSDEESSVE